MPLLMTAWANPKCQINPDMSNSYLLKCSQCGARNRVPHDKILLEGKCGKCGGSLAPAQPLPIAVNDSNWDKEVLDPEIPSIVECWSPHCGVCSRYEAAVRRMAVNFYGRARVLQLNVDENPRTSARYGIRGVPTILLFRRGKLLEALVGVREEAELRRRLACKGLSGNKWNKYLCRDARSTNHHNILQLQKFVAEHGVRGRLAKQLSRSSPDFRFTHCLLQLLLHTLELLPAELPSGIAFSEDVKRRFRSLLLFAELSTADQATNRADKAEYGEPP